MSSASNVSEPTFSDTGGSGGGPIPTGGGGGGDHRDGEPAFSPMLYWLALWITLAVVMMLFAPLGLAYFVRSQNRDFWQPVAIPSMLWVSTVLMLLSSVTFEISRRALLMDRESLHRRWMWITLQLGLAFLIAQVLAWRLLARQGSVLQGNPHSSFFYMFTGLHAIHLLGGLVGLAFVLYKGALGWKGSHARLKRRTVTGIVGGYWHFLDLLWIVLFAILVMGHSA